MFLRNVARRSDTSHSCNGISIDSLSGVCVLTEAEPHRPLEFFPVLVAARRVRISEVRWLTGLCGYGRQGRLPRMFGLANPNAAGSKRFAPRGRQDAARGESFSFLPHP